jgi:hypothetical protein
VACGIQRSVKNSVNGACLASGHDEGGSREMSFYATFVKFRAKDNRPVPVSLPVQLSLEQQARRSRSWSSFEPLADGPPWPTRFAYSRTERRLTCSPRSLMLQREALPPSNSVSPLARTQR